MCPSHCFPWCVHTDETDRARPLGAGEAQAPPLKGRARGSDSSRPRLPAFLPPVSKHARHFELRVLLREKPDVGLLGGGRGKEEMPGELRIWH